MPLVGNGWWEEGKDFGLMAPSLEQLLPEGGITFRGKPLFKERVLLLCALLRVLDGLDIQSDRTISEHYWRERYQRTREEVKYYLDLWDEKRKRSREGSANLDALSKQIKALYNEWVKLGFKSKDLSSADKIKDELLPLVRKALLDNGDPTQLEMLSLADRILFKMEQEAHFLKHSRVKLVYMVQDMGKYKIYMTFEEGFLFSVEDRERIEQIVNKLNARRIPNELKNVFLDNKFSLSENASVEKLGTDGWRINDDKRKFLIRREDGALNIYNEELRMEKGQKKTISEEIWKEIKAASSVLERFGIKFEGVFDGIAGERLHPDAGVEGANS